MPLCESKIENVPYFFIPGGAGQCFRRGGLHLFVPLRGPGALIWPPCETLFWLLDSTTLI